MTFLMAGSAGLIGMTSTEIADLLISRMLEGWDCLIILGGFSPSALIILVLT